ncbi:hypothetical protein AeNC1_019341, partial [Aphanomyces euteiches]
MKATRIEIASQSPPAAFKSKDEKRNLTDDERRAVIDMLLVECSHGTPRYGSKQRVAHHFGISAETVSRIWKRGVKSFADGRVVADVASRMR